MSYGRSAISRLLKIEVIGSVEISMSYIRLCGEENINDEIV